MEYSREKIVVEIFATTTQYSLTREAHIGIVFCCANTFIAEGYGEDDVAIGLYGKNQTHLHITPSQAQQLMYCISAALGAPL